MSGKSRRRSGVQLLWRRSLGVERLGKNAKGSVETHQGVTRHLTAEQLAKPSGDEGGFFQTLTRGGGREMTPQLQRLRSVPAGPSLMRPVAQLSGVKK